VSRLAKLLIVVIVLLVVAVLLFRESEILRVFLPEELDRLLAK